jgi:hypothetical protein
MRLSRRILFLVLSATLAFLCVSRSRAAGPWDNAAAELAGKIVSHLAPRATMALEVKNQSSLDARAAEEITQSLQAALRARGMRVVKSSRPQAQVVVTVSENIQGLVWVAEITRATLPESAPDVVIVEAARPSAESVAPPAETLVLRKTLVYTESDPILDCALIPSPAGAEVRLLVLDTEKIAVYTKQEENWVLEQSRPLARSHPWPRDPRGRLAIQADQQFAAYTPGTECQGTTSPALALECRASDDAWPVSLAEPLTMSAHFVPGRNYFDGKLTLAGKELQVPMFFSAAAIPGTPGPLIVLAALDGRARFFAQKPEPLGTVDDWGSDLAAIQSGCGSGLQILATRAGGLEQPDSVQAFSLRDGTAQQASAPVEFPGPVTALWPAASGREALAVARDLKTGQYEAFTLSISCGE